MSKITFWTPIFKIYPSKIKACRRFFLKVRKTGKGLEKSLPERHHKLIPLNLEAIKIGQENLEVVQTV